MIQALVEPKKTLALLQQAIERLHVEGEVAQVLQASLVLHHQQMQILESTLTTLEFFQTQIFGRKSEKLQILEGGPQLALFEQAKADAQGASLDAPPVEPITSTRFKAPRVTPKKTLPVEGELFFVPERTPVETIVLPCREIEGLPEDAYQRIGEKISYRLAQRPSSYVVLCYKRPQFKILESQRIVCAPAPTSVLDTSRADVSLIAGLLVDKVGYHLPLYRLHQRMQDCGLRQSRQWLTDLFAQASGLLEPIYNALLAQISACPIILMDETPIKAGQAGKGKMHQGYFWPVLVPDEGVCFAYASSREHGNVAKILGSNLNASTTIVTDGYGAYETYAAQTGVKHARCWSHCRRYFFRIAEHVPEARRIVDRIAAIYSAESVIQALRLRPVERLAMRLNRMKPLIQALFEDLHGIILEGRYTPNSPMMRAIAYALKRREGLEMCLKDGNVPLDTNAVERALRPITIGRKNWLFCWTEVGAKHIGIVQSLIATCRIHSIDPYTYLVDVLQRVSVIMDQDVGKLTPKHWKTHFGDQPMRSDLDLGLGMIQSAG